MGKDRIGLAQLFASNRQDVHSAQNRQPLAISSPIGPVKNSRGPDLTRSESLIIVDGIRDCGPGQENDGITSIRGIKTEKKMPISLFSRALQKRGSRATLAGTPKSVAESSGTTPRSNPDQDEAAPSFARLNNASISTTTVFTISGDHECTHATMPSVPTSPQKTKPKFATKLPKSKTMNVLQDIKNAVPLRTPGPFSASKHRSKKTDKAITPLKQPDMSKTDLFRSLRRRSREESASSSRHSSTTNITTPDSAEDSKEKTDIELRPGQVARAQPSMYWTGRFTALRDRLATEHMEDVLAHATDTIQMGALRDESRQCDMNDAAPCGTPPYPLRDEDALCLEIFSILESQCVTPSAKESFKRWRGTYAGCRRRPNLLPPGSAFFGDSQISKRFASHVRHPDRQGLAYLEDAYYSNASNAFGVTNPHSLEGRYLNFR